MLILVFLFLLVYGVIKSELRERGKSAATKEAAVQTQFPSAGSYY